MKFAIRCAYHGEQFPQTFKFADYESATQAFNEWRDILMRFVELWQVDGEWEDFRNWTCLDRWTWGQIKCVS